MKFILEFKSYKPVYEIGDVVLIEYWYSDREDCSPYLYKALPYTPVRIVDKNKNSFKVTHNTPESKIQNAPEQTIKKSDIIDFYR